MLDWLTDFFANQAKPVQNNPSPKDYQSGLDNINAGLKEGYQRKYNEGALPVMDGFNVIPQLQSMLQKDPIAKAGFDPTRVQVHPFQSYADQGREGADFGEYRKGSDTIDINTDPNMLLDMEQNKYHALDTIMHESRHRALKQNPQAVQLIQDMLKKSNLRLGEESVVRQADAKYGDPYSKDQAYLHINNQTNKDIGEQVELERLYKTIESIYAK